MTMVVEPAMPGTDELFRLLALLGDAETYAARLEALEAVRQEVNAKIALVGAVDEVLQARQAAQVDRAAVASELEAARTEADGLITAARREAEAIVAQAEAGTAAAEELTLRLREDARTVEGESARLIDAAVGKLAELAAARRDFEAEREAFAAEKAAFEDRMARLEAALRA